MSIHNFPHYVFSTIFSDFGYLKIVFNNVNFEISSVFQIIFFVFTEYEAFLMFSTITAIDSAHMFDEKEPNTPLKKITSNLMKNAISLTFEYSTKRVFYSDIQKGSINTVFFNGSGHSVLVESEYYTDEGR